MPTASWRIMVRSVMPERRQAETPAGESIEDRLGSWKEIAAYLSTSVRSVQRWEKMEGRPPHRHQHDKRGSVFAYKPEVDRWYEGRRGSLKTEEQAEPPRRHRSTLMLAVVALLAGGLGAVLTLIIMIHGKAPGSSSFCLSMLPPPGSAFRFGIQSGGHAVSPDGNFIAFVA